MRRLLFPLPLLALLAANTARADEAGRRSDGLGVGLGSGTIANGLSLKYFTGAGGPALQGVIGIWGGGGINDRFRHAGGLAVGFDYLWEMPSLARSQYFTVDWNFGLGAGFGVETLSHNDPGVAASGIAGLEFNFTRIPLDVVVEYRPTLGILPKPRLELVDFTGHVRFYF